MLVHYQGYVVNEVGDTIQGASVVVRHEADQVNAQIYSDISAANSLGNPVVSSDYGYFNFFAPQGRYRVTASYSGGTSDLRHVPFVHAFSPYITVTSDFYQISEPDFGNMLYLTNATSAGILIPSSLGHEFEEVHIEAGSGSGLYTLTVSGTLILPASGSAVIIPKGVVTVKRQSSNVWKLFGHTVGA